MPDQGLNFLSLFGGFLQQAGQIKLAREMAQAKQGNDSDPLQELYTSIISDTKNSPEARKQAYQALRITDPRYENLPDINFGLAEKPDLSASERMTTVAGEKPVATYNFPSFDQAMQGGVKQYRGTVGGMSNQEKIQGIQNIAMDMGIPQEKVDRFLQNYGLKENKAEPELTLSQYMDRRAKATPEGQKRLDELFPDYAPYGVNYKDTGGGLGLGYHNKVAEISRLKSLIDETESALKAITYSSGFPMEGREEEVKQLRAEIQRYKDKMKTIKFYGEDVTEPKKKNSELDSQDQELLDKYGAVRVQ